MARKLVVSAACGLTLLCCFASVYSLAEVAVFVGEDGVPGKFIMQTVIDESEPVGISWTPYHPLDPQYQILNAMGVAGDGPPSAVIRSSPGFPIVAWSKATSGGYDIVVSRFEDGQWTQPQVVTTTAADELDPVLTIDDQGVLHLFYWLDDGSPRVLHRATPSSDLSGWSEAELVSAPGEIACRPFATLHDGVLHVVYESHGQSLGSTPRQIVLAILSGASYSAEVVAATSYDGANWPRVHSQAGRLWVDWIDSSSSMGWRERNGVSWDPVELQPFSSYEERELFVRSQIRGTVLGD